MKRVVISGGGWSGCAAAVEAKKLGAEVTLLERTDMLLGTGLVGGIMRNNGRYTATEEMIAMGGGELFGVIEQNLRHKNIEFPGHAHADLYDVAILVSGDGDFIPAVERIKDMGKIVEVVSFSDEICGELRLLSDRFWNLDSVPFLSMRSVPDDQEAI